MIEYVTTILGLCAIAYIVLYVSGRYYLREEFEDLDPNSDKAKFRRMAELHAPSVYNTTAIREDIGRDLPYATKPIMTLDDYEYSMVCQASERSAVSDQSGRLYGPGLQGDDPGTCE